MTVTMKGLAGFMFFLLFLAGLALVNLRGMRDQSAVTVSSDEQLADSAWRPTHLGEMRLSDDTSMFVQFNADGSLIGFAGCNQFFGNYAVADKGVSIGRVGSTRKACPEPINAYEVSFLESLQIVHTAALSDSRLILNDSSGNVLNRFVPAPLAAIAN
ncbi:MAG: META domain-containing protein [Woeseiales bacterium]|jgi:heat shock protein HslJ